MQKSEIGYSRNSKKFRYIEQKVHGIVQENSLGEHAEPDPSVTGLFEGCAG